MLADHYILRLERKSLFGRLLSHAQLERARLIWRYDFEMVLGVASDSAFQGLVEQTEESRLERLIQLGQ